MTVDKNKTRRQKYALKKDKYNEWRRQYSEKNKEKINEYKRENYHKNKVLKPKNVLSETELIERENVRKQKKKEHAKKYREKNIERLRAYDRARSGRKKNYDRQRRKVDPIYKLITNYRTVINNALKRDNHKKHSKTTMLIGCSVANFKAHIEKQFEPWMNWDNWGIYNLDGERTWHIDHIVPLSKFDLSTTEGQQAAFHFTNCRPLCSKQNILKGNKL